MNSKRVQHCGRAAWTALFVLTACSGHELPAQAGPIADRSAEHDRACRRYAVRVAGPYHQELAGPVEHPLLDSMPKEARRTARAGGLEPLVLAMLSLRQDAPRAVELLALNQELFIRLTSLSTQLEALLSELDCTDDVIEQLVALLDARERKREFKLTLASIVVGAVAAAGSGAWQIADETSHGGEVLGITGGAVSAGLGLSALFPRTHTLRYRHAHNLLRPIVQGEDPERFYPTFVRRLLTTPGADGGTSPREQLVEQFEAEIAAAYSSELRAQVREILFGDGGAYDQDLIGLRESMYDELEAKLSTFARELELLTRYLVHLAEASRTPPP